MRRQLTWTRRLGWAATIVLALGTGYLIRDLAGPTGSIERTATADTAAPAARRMQTPTVLDSPVPADARLDMAAESRGAAAIEGRDPTPAGRAPDDARTGAVEETAGAPAGVPGELSDVAAASESPRSKAMLEAAAGDMATTRPTTAGSAAARVPGAGAVPDHRRWTAVSASEARGTLAGPLYVLPRAELLETYVDPGAARVMTLQRLQTGIPVRVIQSRGGADAAIGAPELEREPEAAGRGLTARPAPSLLDIESARVVRGEFVLELSGALPVALLEVLGETAEPAAELQGG